MWSKRVKYRHLCVRCEENVYSGIKKSVYNTHTHTTYCHEMRTYIVVFIQPNCTNLPNTKHNTMERCRHINKSVVKCKCNDCSVTWSAAPVGLALLLPEVDWVIRTRKKSQISEVRISELLTPVRTSQTLAPTFTILQLHIVFHYTPAAS